MVVKLCFRFIDKASKIIWITFTPTNDDLHHSLSCFYQAEVRDHNIKQNNRVDFPLNIGPKRYTSLLTKHSVHCAKRNDAYVSVNRSYKVTCSHSWGLLRLVSLQVKLNEGKM